MLHRIASARAPSLVAHADWGTAPRKRRIARARRHDGTWAAGAPESVGEPTTLLDRLAREAGGGSVLVGFDFPIGLPWAYAEPAGIRSFPDALLTFGEDFYAVARQPEEVSLRRPFYPHRGNGTKRDQLVAGLGVAAFEELLRRCERATGDRRAAAPLFWTLGGQQVGRAAISGWRDVLAPALANPRRDVKIWPFDGRLDELCADARVVVAETYAREFYDHIGIGFRGAGKTDRDARAANAEALLEWADGAGVSLSDDLTATVRDGFGSDDEFDAVVGLFGMLNVVLGRRSAGEPDDERVRTVEGWIVGRAP